MIARFTEASGTSRVRRDAAPKFFHDKLGLVERWIPHIFRPLLSLSPSQNSFSPSQLLSTLRIHPVTQFHMAALSRRLLQVHPRAHTIPPNHPAKIGFLTTFNLPSRVTGSPSDQALARDIIRTWRKDGIFQIRLPTDQAPVLRDAFATSRAYFARPFAEKARHVDDQSFAGYIASGEELTDGIADYSEIFTVTKDLPPSDPRVQARWPCHGPCPWPDPAYQRTMDRLMQLFGRSGDILLRLTALGLNLASQEAFTQLTDDGWHHMRILRFPHVEKTNGKGKAGRGIGSHTDYGLLVLAAQDSVGGLFVRPPMVGEKIRNWESSAAGFNEDDSKWTYVPPEDDVLTVFPGDMMQYMTNDYLPSTPHKVGLNTDERFAFAYFHEPNFSAVVKPLPECLARTSSSSSSTSTEGIHYGTHFTNMFMRNYPERITAKRMLAENRMALLQTPELRNTPSPVHPTTTLPPLRTSPKPPISTY